MNKLFTKIAGAVLGLTMVIGVGTAFGTSRQEVIPASAATIGTHLQQVTELTSGNQYVIVGNISTNNGNTSGYALPTNPTVSSGKVTGTAINEVPNDGSGFLWTFTKSGSYWLIGDGSRYIYHSNGGNSGTNLSYGTSQANYPWSLTYSTSTQNHWTFAGVVASSSTVKTRGMLCNEAKFGGYALSNESLYKYMNIYEVVSSSKITTTTTVTAAEDKTTLDVTVSPADTVQLSATVTPDSGSIVSPSITWTSSNVSAATVSSSGLVTAVAKGTTTITASYAGDSTYDGSTGTIEITVGNPNEKSYSLKFGGGIVTTDGWSNSYGVHNGYTKTETGIGTLTFNFAAASKQSSNITEYPVGKDGAVEMVLSSTNYYIKDVTFNGVQWTTKTQTMTINYSTDGGSTYTATDASSDTFTVSKSNLTVGTNAIKITFSNSSNQVGHKNFEVAFAEKPVLSSVTTSGQTTSFDFGDPFTYGGTLTAHYTAGKADTSVTPNSFKYGASGINPESAGTVITLGTTLTDSTHNGQYIYVSYTEDNITKWTSGYQITVGAAPSYYMTLSVSTDTGTNYGYKGGIIEVEITSSSLAGNIVWTVTSGSVSDAVSDNTSYMATIASAGTLTITATDSGDATNTQSVSITVIDSLNAVNAPNVTNHSSELTFTDKYGEGGEQVNGETSDIWTVTSDGTESVFDEVNGIHYGTNSANVQYVQLSTSSVAIGANDTIKSVVVNTQDRASSKGALTVTVGGVPFKHEGSSSITVTGVAADYTFTGNGTGEIVVKVDRGSAATKAIYVKSVTVNYVTENGTTNIANAVDMHLAQKAVIDYANDFNTALEAVCVAYGSTDTTDLENAWNDLVDQYDNWFNNSDKELTAEEIAHAKALFANADSADREKVATADELQHMLAKYDWIISHYQLNDFLANDSGTNRPIVQNSSPRIDIFGNIDSSNTTAIIVIVSLVSLTAVGGYFFLRKRKEEI